MRIGLTYDLREAYLAAGYGEEETAELDSIETVEAVEGVLRRRGFETDRIGSVRDLAARLVAGDRWDLVFNFAEGLHGIGREAQVPALLDAWRIPYTFSDPLVLSLTLHKGMTKRVVRDAGIPT
ncbi:MAG: D-alanine--D-alanine ligase, partial [Rhodospirillaceae bacterium]|nr:D-alanine--D-alanine ligase [Rhodospirillaceae bacterium]